MQGFLQLNDIGSHYDPHLRIIGGHHETLESHNTHMLQNKGETMHHEVHTTQTQLRESPAHPKKCVLSGNHLYTGPFLVAMGIFSDIERRRKNTLVHLLKIEKKKKKKARGQPGHGALRARRKNCSCLVNR